MKFQPSGVPELQGTGKAVAALTLPICPAPSHSWSVPALALPCVSAHTASSPWRHEAGSTQCASISGSAQPG